MLTITVQLSEEFDTEKNEFVYETFDLELEHSLVSLSKWESKYEKAFLGKEEKTNEQVLGYVEAMILTPDYPSDLLKKLSDVNVDEINTYIDRKMTATWFSERRMVGPPARETITSELIYYWIVSYQIPWEVETWHLNRLFTLIKVFNDKNNTKRSKRSAKDIATERMALNEQRRAKLGTHG